MIPNHTTIFCWIFIAASGLGAVLSGEIALTALTVAGLALYAFVLWLEPESRDRVRKADFEKAISDIAEAKELAEDAAKKVNAFSLKLFGASSRKVG